MIKRKDGMHEYYVIKGYKLENAEIEKETIIFFSHVDQQTEA